MKIKKKVKKSSSTDLHSWIIRGEINHHSLIIRGKNADVTDKIVKKQKIALSRFSCRSNI